MQRNATKFSVKPILCTYCVAELHCLPLMRAIASTNSLSGRTNKDRQHHSRYEEGRWSSLLAESRNRGVEEHDFGRVGGSSDHDHGDHGLKDEVQIHCVALLTRERYPRGDRQCTSGGRTRDSGEASKRRT